MCVHPIWLPRREKGYSLTDDKGSVQVSPVGQMGTYVPCGKCPECFKHRQNVWYIRFVHEELWQRKYGFKPYFITLTYKDDSLPGRIQALKDWQAFTKQFKRFYGIRMRFYAVTENGGLHDRLHWHALVFNFPAQLDDKQIRNFIEKAWHKGFVQANIANPKQFRYVTKYITKDAQVSSGSEPPIQVYSKRPALGYEYARYFLSGYLNNPDVGRIYNNGYSYGIPRYYSDKLVRSDVRVLRNTQNSKVPYLPEQSRVESVERIYQKTIAEAKRKKQINYAKLEIKDELKKHSRTS